MVDNVCPVIQRGNGMREHPTRETLLAFICEQCSAHEKNRINEHLQSGCAPCNRLRADLTQSSNALNHLKYMSGCLSYPELQSNQVLFHMQRGEFLTSALTGKRKRKFQIQSSPVRRPQATGRYAARKAGLRYVSIPAAFAMLILFTIIVVTLVYALANMGKLPFPINLPTNIFHSDPVPYNTSVAMHQVTPTNTVPVTITPTPTVSATGAASPTQTSTIIKGAGLDACSPDQYVGSTIFICGYGFKAGDKVWLEVDYYGSNSLKTLGPYTVNKNGEFKAYWSISCKNSPVIVYAADKMQQPLTVPLMNISRYGCYLPTPTTTPGGYQWTN